MRVQHGVSAPAGFTFTYRRAGPVGPPPNDVCTVCHQPIPYPGPYFWRSHTSSIIVCQSCASRRWART